jgi:D-alanine-D-alanine ligase-like ATP-grasp enzyme
LDSWNGLAYIPQVPTKTSPFLALAPRARDAASGESQRARLASMGPALRKAGFDFSLEEVGDREELVGAIRRHGPDLALCSFFRFGLGGPRRDAHEALQRERVPFVGSPSAALELALSKSRLKRLFEERGIRTPGYFRVRRTRTGAIAGLRLIGAARDYPYIVKPDCENENRGITPRSIAFDKDALVSSVEAALEEYDELIVEHFHGGAETREYTVAMIGNGAGALMMPAEIRLRDPRPIRVVTRVDRERNLTQALPIVDFPRRARIAAFARAIFEASGVRDYARCDLIEEEGRLYALEVNGQPRLPDPWFEACSSGGGLDSEQYLAAVALAALHRHRSAGPGRLGIPSALRAMLPPAVFERLTR